ncbi:O-fucosyltransferase 8 [Magnolia sinica]|uniref:O-fucosyltransferase 8 n=1 Tax=Magnolia sinica TaxID=86752 RepID=UPI002659A530|nr:O-fucosyltransferase 8 [Magnolia sinica]
MGKQGSPKWLRLPPFSNESVNVQKPSFSTKNNKTKSLDSTLGGDPSLGRKTIGGDYFSGTKGMVPNGSKNANSQLNASKGSPGGRRPMLLCKHVRTIGFVLVLLGSFFLLDSLMLSLVHRLNLQSGPVHGTLEGSQKDEGTTHVDNEETPKVMYKRLLDLASRALVENQFKPEPSTLWKEPYKQASAWKPCTDKDNLQYQGKTTKSNGYILVSANGGLNQQRVAVCNAVVVASLLNATLVLPKFLYSSVWKDPSQFGDIYQEEYFMHYLKDDLSIVKQLPSHLQSLDFEAIGSLITDADIMKEAKPIYFVNEILPLLRRNGVVHFLGFGNRLAFDPLPSKLQRLRCKCNFHALKFVPKIQRVGALLVRRIRKYDVRRSLLDKQLFGKFMPSIPPKQHEALRGPSKYLALHLRFEMDMVAYSLCDFGGGENERKELQAYREIHFPLLIMRMKDTEFTSPSELRKLGRCPLTPEEAALMLSALGYKRGTYIYLAGSDLYGGKSRMLPFTTLYPNLVTKEDFLMPSELAPFRNFSSKMAALDFIACATSDVFAMTDSGSQLSSLVTGYRTYYGGGYAPTLRPNKKRFASILSENGTIEWSEFEGRVRKMIDENQRVRVRRVGRSIYRQPRCPECMCKIR